MARILVIDNPNPIASGIQSCLTTRGYHAPTAASAREAFETIEQNRPDLVLINARLSGEMDGVETAQRIRDLYRLPVVYLTAQADSETLSRAKRTEPYGFIPNLFNEDELCSAVETALKRCEIERQLKANHAWLEAILRSIGDAVIVADENGLVTFLNPVAETLTGFSPEEALGKGLSVVFRTAGDDGARQPAIEILEGGRGQHVIERTLLVSKHGRQIPVSGNISSVKSFSPNLTGVVLVFRDLTQTEKTLSMFKTTLDLTADGIAVVTRDQRILHYNRRCAEMWRIPESVMALGDSPTAVNYVLDQLKDPQTFFEGVERLFDNPEMESVDILEFKDGRLFERVTKPHRVGDEIVGRVFSFRDITESSRGERRLRQANRRLELAQQGNREMALILSHELKTPLSVIREGISLLADGLEGPVSGGQAQVLEILARNTGRLDRLVEGILEVSGRETPEAPATMAEQDLTALCMDVYDRLKPAAARKRVHFSYNLPRERIPVLCDAEQIRQTLSILVESALGLTDKGHKIRMSLQRGEHEAVIELLDNGRGLPRDRQRRLFKPFDPDGGAGLAACKRIMDGHGGRLSVESDPGAGSKFMVILPTLPDSAP